MQQESEGGFDSGKMRFDGGKLGKNKEVRVSTSMRIHTHSQQIHEKIFQRN